MDRHRVSVTYIVVRNLEFNGEFLAVGISELHLKGVGFIGDVFLLTLPYGVGIAACSFLGLAQGESAGEVALIGDKTQGRRNHHCGFGSVSFNDTDGIGQR